MIDVRSLREFLGELLHGVLVAIDPGEDPEEVPTALELAPELHLRPAAELTP